MAGMNVEVKDKEAFQEVQSRLISLTRQSQQARSHVQQRTMDQKRCALTLAELQKLDDATKVYRPVGKMFVQDQRPSLIKDLETRAMRAGKEVETLSSTITYLDKQLKDCEANLRELIITPGA